MEFTALRFHVCIHLLGGKRTSGLNRRVNYCAEVCQLAVVLFDQAQTCVYDFGFLGVTAFAYGLFDKAFQGLRDRNYHEFSASSCESNILGTDAIRPFQAGSAKGRGARPCL